MFSKVHAENFVIRQLLEQSQMNIEIKTWVLFWLVLFFMTLNSGFVCIREREREIERERRGKCGYGKRLKKQVKFLSH